MRVAIFGGSFNPPHLGHQVLCLMVLETCEIDELWVVPTYSHVFGKDLAPFTQRVECCREMLLPLGPKTKVLEIEKELALAGQSENGSRMLNTLEALTGRYPDAGCRLVIGADILAERDKWYRFEEVARLAPPIVFKRHGFAGGDLAAPPDISSREIRGRIARQEAVRELVPRRVLRVIERLSMYT